MQITFSFCPYFSFAQFINLWTQTNNSSLYLDYALAVTIDTSGIYIAGYDESFGPGDDQWRIEKRDLATGGLIWLQTNNIGPSSDVAKAIAVDTSGIYVVGYDSPGSVRWRIEKRDVFTGAIIWIQTINLSNSDVAYAIAVDSSGIYIAGYDNSPGPLDTQWRIEKRDLTTGSLVWAQTSNPSVRQDVATAITVAASGIYIAGYDNSPGPSDYQWRIEKRNLTSGNIIWSKTSNPSTNTDEYPNAIAVDSTGIYIAGRDEDLGSGNSQWRIEKRDLNTGSLLWFQTNNPSQGADFVTSITIDSSALYLVGVDYFLGNQQWRIEKCNLATGSLICTITSNPSVGNDNAFGISVDSTGIYLVGIDDSLGNEQWRIEKYNKCDGTTTIISSKYWGTIEVFPTISSGLFTIKNGNVKINSIEIYNILGESVFICFQKETNNQINLTDFPNGIYFLHLKTQHGTKTKKLILNK